MHPSRKGQSEKVRRRPSIPAPAQPFTSIDYEHPGRFDKCPLFSVGRPDICTVFQYSAHNHDKCHLINPAAESPFTRSDANLDRFTQSQDEYQTPLTNLPCTSRRQSLNREHTPDRLYAIGLNGSTCDVLGCVRRRERRSSELCNNDLSGVEELDEGTRRGGRPGYSSGSAAEVSPNTDSPPRGAVLPQPKGQLPIDQRDPVWLDGYHISSE